jgi:hypothetical protein
MATVYLPMGYPTLSGSEFEYLIYQGNMVRMYTIPTDPRSDAQLVQRKFLSDVVKVRKCLGLFGKGACRTALGPTWQSVLYQIIKADVGEWWSAALDEWDSFGEVNQEAWRVASPYQATYNDVGQIYFCLTRVIYRALLHYTGIAWGAEEWAEDESAAALVWWQKDLDNVFLKGKYDDRNAVIDYVGAWGQQNNAYCYQGTYVDCGNPLPAKASFYYWGRYVAIWFFKGASFGSCDIRVDGGEAQTVDQNFAYNVYDLYAIHDGVFKGLHYCEIYRHMNTCNFDAIEVSNV